MPPQTQSKTVSITNTRLAIATLALVGAAALAFAAIPSLPEGYVCGSTQDGIAIQEGENTHYTANNYCINERTVAEFVCNVPQDDGGYIGGEIFHSESIQCDGDELCENGACVRQDYGRSCVMSEDDTVAKICADESCNDVIQSLSDHCIDSETLGMVSCEDGLIQVTKVNCDNGCVLGDDNLGSCALQVL
jgi:hypothetical protein